MLELSCKDRNPKQLSPLTLAFIGDAVYELLARERVLSFGNMPVNNMHNKTVQIVNAAAQSASFLQIEPVLTEEELAIFRRGRNASPGSLPKHANPADYHRATGLETLFGYLYLSGNTQRIQELFDLTFAAAQQE